MKKSLIALAFGTLGLGIAEFVMMGILPDVARDLGISIATAVDFGLCFGSLYRGSHVDFGTQVSVKVYLDVFGGSNDAGKYLCSFIS